MSRLTHAAVAVPARATHNPAVARRFHVPRVAPGLIPLDPAQSRHARDVLRLAEGAEVEVFDDDGASAAGVLVCPTPAELAVRVGSGDFVNPRTPGLSWTVASAVPKGERADWMVEKLSELGCAAFVPLKTQRSVVHPEGTGKLQRWERLAVESAKQSRRAGVMRIEPLVLLDKAVGEAASAGRGATRKAAWYFSTAPGARPVADVGNQLAALAPSPLHLWLFVGPEGGWSEEEEAGLSIAGLTPVGLTSTILRVETAAVAAAAVVASLLAPKWAERSSSVPDKK